MGALCVSQGPVVRAAITASSLLFCPLFSSKKKPTFTLHRTQIAMCNKGLHECRFFEFASRLGWAVHKAGSPASAGLLGHIWRQLNALDERHAYIAFYAIWANPHRGQPHGCQHDDAVMVRLDLATPFDPGWRVLQELFRAVRLDGFADVGCLLAVKTLVATTRTSRWPSALIAVMPQNSITTCCRALICPTRSCRSQPETAPRSNASALMT